MILIRCSKHNLGIYKKTALKAEFFVVDPDPQKLELFFDIILGWEPILRQIRETEDKEKQ